MDPETMKKLRVDRRLLQRRGWIDDAELSSVLEGLPDVSDKIAPAEAPPVAAAPAARPADATEMLRVPTPPAAPDPTAGSGS